MTRFLAWLLILTLLTAPVALADEDDDKDGKREGRDDRDDRDDDDRDRDSRKLRLDVDDGKATIKLAREIAGLEDAVKIAFDTRKARIEVKHEMENATTESESKLEARFLSLLEYVDADGDGAYDPGETVASAWSLSDSGRDAKIPTNGTVDWRGVDVSDVTTGNVTGKKLSSRASFGPNATFGLDFFVYGTFTHFGDHSLLPTEAKIDIIIEHYPYVRPDSALALIVDLKAKEEFENEEGDDEDGPGVFSEMSAGNLSFRLIFTWLPNATVDGVDRDVRSTVLKEREEIGDDEIAHKARVAIGYPRGDRIVHDPTVGVDYTTQSDDARQVPVPGVLLVVATVALVALAVSGRRR